MKEKLGFSGKFADMFINSKLTPVLIILALAIGLFATSITSREEEPQITVPMVDVFVDFPGAAPAEVEERVTKPVEKLLAEISGVEYIYSQAMPGRNLTIVRFKVGENPETSLTKLYSKLMANYDIIPPGVSQPIIKMRSIDDVPVLTLTLWDKSGQSSAFDLRRIALVLSDTIKQDSDVSEVKVLGGQPREISVYVDPATLSAYGLTMDKIIAAAGAGNSKANSGLTPVDGKSFTVTAGNFVTSLTDAKQIVVSAQNGKAVLLGDIAKVTDGAGEPTSYVLTNSGAAAHAPLPVSGAVPAVTISVAKKTGVNATALTTRLLSTLNQTRKDFVPGNIEITTTRNYGETANDKSNELLEHMLLATLAVVLLIAFTLGRREAIVVAVAIPVTLALTLMVNWLYGYTLNRVTLFALIFSIGILVDDAIVVVENIHRHFLLHGFSRESAVKAVDEVGNPTILATFTVIASLLPMAFVSGLMGPYMRPIPVGASAAMLFSLAVAFAITPWLALRLLHKGHYESDAVCHGDEQPNMLQRWYEKTISILLNQSKKRRQVLAAVAILLVAAAALVPLKMVAVKMLPFDNKSEFQVIVDMDEGTSLETTTAAATALGQYLTTVPELANYQIYSGSASPYNFNGLVRHYFLRQNPWQADIQVNLAPKSERSRSSHEIAKAVRPELIKIAATYNARIKVAEVPPGPPVLSTLVAEVYGPDLTKQREIAKTIKNIFSATPDVVDVDWYVEADQPKIHIAVDAVKAAQNGISVADVARSSTQVISGAKAGLVHFPRESEPVFLNLQIPYSNRTQLTTILQQIPVQSALTGNTVPLSELVTLQEGSEQKTIYHKNLRRVTYVIGDMAGVAESPAYGIINMLKPVDEIMMNGNHLKQYSSVQPTDPSEYAMKWDGEWHVTYEVFRDMGIAFAVVLVLIYILVLAWFKDFLLPLVIMTPIPLTLIGILPGHWVFGAFFTATSMIGFIALSGIIVRNSILLVDFANTEHRAGMAYKEALTKAGVIRMRPIILTAAAVVVGSLVMLMDPIFQGLAIAMMFGAVVATILTLLVIPLLCWELQLWHGKQPKQA